MNTIIQKRIIDKANAIINFNLVDLNDLVDRHDLFKMLIEIAAYTLENQWISVEEDLPPYDKDVFVRFISRFPNNTDEFEVGYCTRWRTLDKSVKTDSKGFSIIGDMEITHWMYIPSLEGGGE